MKNITNINHNSISEFLTLGFTLEDNTFRNGEKINRLTKMPEFETNRKSSINDVEISLKNSIKKAVKGKEKIAVHLSGGKDTRLVAALTNSLGINFTAVTFGENTSVDIVISKKIAKKLDVEHKIYSQKLEDIFNLKNINEFVKSTDGLLPFTYLSTYIIDNEISKEFDVILSGNMMSEIMDTWDFKKHPKDPLKEMKKRWRYFPTIVTDKYKNNINKKLNNMYSKKDLETIMIETTIKNVFFRGLDYYISHEINNYPIVFDKESLSDIYSLPFSKRRNCYLSKKIIKKNNPSLLKIPYSYSGYMIPLFVPYIIHQILRKVHARGKNKFFGPYDIGYYTAYGLKNFIKNKIDTLDIDFINRDEINKILYNHFHFNYNISAIGRLVTLKIWLENNI